jgi:hypothetical protein
MEPLIVDSERVAMCWRESGEAPPLPNETPNVTGIYVRAKYHDKWGAHDIAVLTRESLFQWLRSRGGANDWAEQVVFALLHYRTDGE